MVNLRICRSRLSRGNSRSLSEKKYRALCRTQISNEGRSDFLKLNVCVRERRIYLVPSDVYQAQYGTITELSEEQRSSQAHFMSQWACKTCFNTAQRQNSAQDSAQDSAITAPYGTITICGDIWQNRGRRAFNYTHSEGGTGAVLNLPT
jgi:hypothetical protein